VGALGRNHARIYSELESAELVGIYDSNEEHARAIADEFGTAAVSSLEELVSRIDAASVSTPTVTHREIATTLLNAGKHVLVEKPISDSVDDAKAMIDLAHEKVELPSLYFAHEREVLERDGILLADCDYIMKRPEEKTYKATVRCRTIGDMTCTGVWKSDASNVEDIIEEIATTRLTERGGRTDDKRSETSMEDRKKEGYF